MYQESPAKNKFPAVILKRKMRKAGMQEKARQNKGWMELRPVTFRVSACFPARLWLSIFSYFPAFLIPEFRVIVCEIRLFPTVFLFS